MTLTVKDQAKRRLGSCAKEEVSSSLLDKLAPPFLCYKHIPSHHNIYTKEGPLLDTKNLPGELAGYMALICPMLETQAETWYRSGASMQAKKVTKIQPWSLYDPETNAWFSFMKAS